MLKAVLDIGKTHIKLLLLENGQQAACFNSKNAPIEGAYLHADTAGIWGWLCNTLRDYPRAPEISAIVVTTHGATAALINRGVANRDDGLVLPVVDYEYKGVEQCEADYAEVRPPFNETFSPSLPAGLNLAKQLFWLQANYTDAFNRATDILMYPQYWTWRLGAEPVTEVTSLGCHTDLWQPGAKDYSSLVERCGWRSRFPPLKNAWDEIGTVSEAASAGTGLPTTCRIHAGIHDSNASLLRYLPDNEQSAQSVNVISTGTWTIIMQTSRAANDLQGARDTLANVDIFGRAVNCARFMGGREYETICTTLGGDITMSAEPVAIQQAIDESWMVTPDFSDGNGPFGHAKPALLCPQRPVSPQAIATLYCALMIDQRLSDLKASGPVYIEGAFLKNPLLCQLVAQLRPEQPVMLSQDNTGTVLGAASLMNFNHQAEPAGELSRCQPSAFLHLTKYKARWYEAIAATSLQK